MANTFLNTNRAISATSNPEANVSQVNPDGIKPLSSTEPIQKIQPTQTTNNAVNPITIPIQIQPQIDSNVKLATTQNQSNIQPLQANVSANNQKSNAPTPQTYNSSNNASNNVVDFNQIYSSYQNAYGNNQKSTNSTNTSGIKKTSIGSTIVTPTNTNLNSVKGQYQSAYADTINGLISEMLTQMKTGFTYDPTTDESLKVASEYAANSTLQSLAGSGVLNSSATAERVARIVSELIPQYEEKAHSRWTEYLGQLANTAQIVMNYDSQQFQYWKDAKDRDFQEREFTYKKQQDALENAWKRVDELGYVDNKASTILGVKVGTLSGQARQAKEQQEFELRKMREQAAIEKANNEALYKLRSELDKQYEDYKYQLQIKYGTNKTSAKTTNLSTYKDIINNRWAEKDLMTDQYSINETSNKEIYEYLEKEYNAGRLSDSDASALIAMYGVTRPQTINKEVAKSQKNNKGKYSFGFSSGGGIR